MNPLGLAIKRFFRNALATLIAGGISALLDDPRFIMLAPILNALAKYLREKNKKSFLPL